MQTSDAALNGDTQLDSDNSGAPLVRSGRFALITSEDEIQFAVAVSAHPPRQSRCLVGSRGQGGSRGCAGPVMRDCQTTSVHAVS